MGRSDLACSSEIERGNSSHIYADASSDVCDPTGSSIFTSTEGDSAAIQASRTFGNASE